MGEVFGFCPGIKHKWEAHWDREGRGERRSKIAHCVPQTEETHLGFLVSAFYLGMALRMQEYAVHADYAHMRDYADVDENLIQI